MIYPWKLKYWQTGEWQVVNERLKDMEKAGERYNPVRSQLFAGLRSLKAEDVRVAIIGQDPYPNPEHATGLAFSIPRRTVEGSDQVQIGPFPPTLKEILKEYSADTGYPIPDHGDLSRWAERGVLLWNAIPSCRAFGSLSHDWDEWSYLTREIITKLSDQGGIVFAFLGGVARRYEPDVDTKTNKVLHTSHPSPRGSLNSRVPFVGSRIFTTINSNLADLGKPPIMWRLTDAERDPSSEGVPRSGLV